MADNTKGLSALAGAGNPATSQVESPKQEPTTEPPEQVKPEFITRAEALAMLEERDKRLRQSLTDRDKRIQTELDRLDKAGIKATPEQVQALVQAEPDPIPAQPSRRQTSQPEPRGSEIHPAISIAENRMKRAGIDPETLTQDDPDFSKINFQALNTDDDDTFLNSVNEFIAANKARRGSQARLPMAGNRTGGGTEAALVEEMNRLIAESPSKNAKRISEIGGLLRQKK